MVNGLLMQTTYDCLEIGLSTDNTLMCQVSADKKVASKEIIIYIQSLLDTHGMTLSDLSFIAVNQGPAPFTSLRVVITTANGISFGSNLPVIGIDGLQYFLDEHQSQSYPATIALFNAFNNDAYIGFYDADHVFQSMVHPIEIGLQRIKELYPNQTVRFIGSGVPFFASAIAQIFDHNAHIPNPLPAYLSLGYMAPTAFDYWQKRDVTSQVLPLYIKTIQYKKAI
jgi:tRNA threonylcarbamoyl adenosine modification protein YeaZ